MGGASRRALPPGANAMALNVTISDPEADAYLSLVDARKRLDGFPPHVQDKWDGATSEQNWEWLLIRGTTLIDQYADWGPLRVATQKLRFPRAADSATAIPERVLQALAEYVGFVLDGGMVGVKKLQEEGVETASILGQSQSFAEERSGLPAGARRELDHLRRSDWGGTPLHRDSPGSTLPGQDEKGIFFGGPG